MILTRYLYKKSQVEYSLFISLLNRDCNEALFWTYELYFSGFKTETFLLLIKYYYMLYGAFYVCLEKFVQSNFKKWLNNKNDHTCIGFLTLNLANREPCIDIYFMMSNKVKYPNIFNKYLENIEYNPLDNLRDFVTNFNCYNDYSILDNTYNLCNIKEIDNEILKYASISRMFSGLFLLDKINRLDINVDILNFTETDLKPYLKRPIKFCKNWKLPEKQCKYKVKIPIEEEGISWPDLQNWMVNGWGCPLWKKRISNFGGSLCDNKIVFTDDDEMELFHNYYDLEPEEQPRIVVDQWFGEKPFKTYNQLYKKYKLDVFKEWFKERLKLVVNK